MGGGGEGCRRGGVFVEGDGRPQICEGMHTYIYLVGACKRWGEWGRVQEDVLTV